MSRGAFSQCWNDEVDQIDVEALLDEHLGQEAEARVAARLVAKLDAHGDHGDAAARARLGALCVGLRIHGCKYTKLGAASARRTANPHEPRRIHVRHPGGKRAPASLRGCAFPVAVGFGSSAFPAPCSAMGAPARAVLVRGLSFAYY